MRRYRSLLAAFLTATALQAQCFQEPNLTHTNLGTGDDTLLAMQSIGFAFPFAGTTYTNLHISTNGLLYLSNAGVPAPGTANGDGAGDYSSAAAQLATLLSGAPKILPFYRDLNIRTDQNAGVYIRPGTPSPSATPCLITWLNAVDYNNQGPAKTIQCQLHDNGQIEFYYSGTANIIGAAEATIGRSPGAGSIDPGASDISTSPVTASDVIYQQFTTGTFDLQGKSVTLVPTSPGNAVSVSSCDIGTHTKTGSGCYGDSFYQLFPDSASASAALQGNSLTLFPTATGYVSQWTAGGAASYVPPAGATDFTRSDDGQEVLDLAANSLPNLLVPGGSKSMLWVHSNGFVSTTGATNDNGAWSTAGNDYTPNRSFLVAPETAFWFWHDFNPSDASGGPIRWHYDSGLQTLYLTWDGVENWSVPPATNPGTFQLQLQLTTGVVRYVWVTVDTDTTSIYGTGHLVGYSPGGISADPGQIPLATAGGTTTINGYTALTLAAAPLPVIGGGSSNPITYTVSNMPDYATPSGVRVGMLIFSVAPAPGIDLGLIGAGGCQVYIGSLDVQLPIVALGSPNQSLVLTFPAPLAVGLSFYSQAVALIPAASFPGGLNAFGLLTSNGVVTTF